MKALTLWQPWASLCVLPKWSDDLGGRILRRMHEEGVPQGIGANLHPVVPPPPFKTIETRSWPAPKALIGQRIAIHAATKRPRDLWQDSFRAPPPWPLDLAPFYEQERYIEITESSDGDWFRYRWAGPLGAIVGTAVLTDCVPMTSPHDEASPTVGHVRQLILGRSKAVLASPREGRPPLLDGEQDVSDQLPFGDFAPGRWAWLLADAVALAEPVPAVGRQGVWNWEKS